MTSWSRIKQQSQWKSSKIKEQIIVKFT